MNYDGKNLEEERGQQTKDNVRGRDSRRSQDGDHHSDAGGRGSERVERTHHQGHQGPNDGLKDE